MSRLLSKTLSVLLFLMGLTVSNPLLAEEALIQNPEVKQFINQCVKTHHFNKKRLIHLFTQVKIRPQVMQNINKPLETQPWRTYQMLFVSPLNISEGIKFWQKHERTLKRAEKMYGVPASIIVATIGIETRYGQRKGDFRVMDSLTNIAFSDSPRAKFFKRELEQFLLLTREQHLNPLKIMGSYAGAIGIPQFMPSSYRYYAVNFSNSGKINLIQSEIDAIGSIANYYKLNGWITQAPVVMRTVKLGDRYNYLKRNNKITQPLTLKDAVKLGLIPRHKLIKENEAVKVIELNSNFSKEYWLGFHNFDVIKRYNASDLYAMAVYELSHHLRVAREKKTHG